METDRNQQIANQIDKTLTALEEGSISSGAANNEILRLKNLMATDISDNKNQIQRRKYPKSNSLSKEEQLIGEAKKQRAYNILNADLSVIKNEMQKAANTKDYDFLFTLADCVYSDTRFKDAEKFSIDRIYQQAINDTKILDLVDSNKKLSHLTKETDYILSRLGTIDHADLKRNAQFERARWEIVLVKEQTDRPTKPFAEFIKEIQ